jgi:hypothetical protein
MTPDVTYKPWRITCQTGNYIVYNLYAVASAIGRSRHRDIDWSTAMGVHDDAKGLAKKAAARKLGPLYHPMVAGQRRIAQEEITAWFGESGIEINDILSAGSTYPTSDGTACEVNLTWTIEDHEYSAHYGLDPHLGGEVTISAKIKIGDSWRYLEHYGFRVSEPRMDRPNVKLAIGRALLAHE